MTERARILSEWIDYLDRLSFPFQSPPPPQAAQMRNTDEVERLLQAILDLLTDMRSKLMGEPEAPAQSSDLPATLPADLALTQAAQADD